MKILGLAALLLLAPVAAHAACSTTPQTLAALASGGCLQGGASTFSNWRVSAVGDTRVFNPNAIEVRPGTFGSADGLQFQGGFTTRSLLNVMIQYKVSGAAAYPAVLLYLVVGAGDLGSQGYVYETIQQPGGPVLKQEVTSLAGPASALATFPAQPELLVTTHVYLACPTGASCAVSLSEFQEDFLRR